MTLQYGKYNGFGVSEVPSEYLKWLVQSNRESLESAEAELRRREMEDEANVSMAELVIKTGFRELSRRFHPDAGGNHTDMVELNAAMAQLRGSL